MVQIPIGVDSGTYLSTAAPLVEKHGGIVLAAARADTVECLESGTPAAAMLLVQAERSEQIEGFWSSGEHQTVFASLQASPDLVALVALGLPYEGLPDMLEIPTTASVTPPEGRGPRAYMIVQGSATDQTRMDQYRDIILPMIKAQGAYYTAFEIEGNVELLSGEWPHDIFAISRWPDYAAGHAFWDSDRYQNRAIPARTGAGSFSVHYFVGDQG